MRFARTSWMYAGLVIALGCAAQQKTVRMTEGTGVPAVQASVAVEPQGPNTSLTLQAEHLAPPQNVDAGADAFVAWVRPLDRKGEPVNVGALRLNENLEASLDTVTPFEKFELFVTAEPSGNAVVPLGPRILWSTIR